MAYTTLQKWADRNLEIKRFLQVLRSSVYKVGGELNENNGDELATSKRKEYYQLVSKKSVWQDRRKSWQVNATSSQRLGFKCLKE